MSAGHRLFENQSSVFLLLGVAAAILLVDLGAAELWTMEGRWAAVCMHMIRSGDYFHPYLFGNAYYDKPLLSYWLALACARLLGGLDETALRLPSALAGLLSVWCMYRLGAARFDRATGLLAGFLLASCVMFVFWARVASADMLNVAGTLAAVTWYFERRERPRFLDYTVFFVLLGITGLMKGLIGPGVALLAVMLDVARAGRWRTLLRPPLFVAAAIGLAFYFAPFAVSSLTKPPSYGESGLGMMLQENAVRYFEPFDHQAPVYVYLGVLPVYLLPWTLILPFVVYGVARRWAELSEASRWPIWTCVLIFCVLTASGSRRSYYILPIVPFAILMIADWLRSADANERLRTSVNWVAVGTLAGMLLWFGVVVPAGFRHGGERVLARQVRDRAEREAPWGSWKVLICGAPPAAGYYFRTGPEPTVVPIEKVDTVAGLIERDPHTLVLTKRRFADSVRSILPAAAMLEEPSRVPHFLRPRHGSDRDVIAFVP
ncbi:MAG TPA: glycosyltransferase family 39 protein [Candidatus Binatia bacterium]|nr:glycosyltransferase family 39 protein [Candidatus Binatia bacterium]